jgi:hypothetical protein
VQQQNNETELDNTKKLITKMYRYNKYNQTNGIIRGTRNKTNMYAGTANIINWNYTIRRN